MEKLTLEEIAPYLAYGVKTINGEIIGLRNWLGWCATFKDETGERNIPITHIAPILFPLESIFTEVDFWGQKVCVINEMEKVAQEFPDLITFLKMYKTHQFTLDFFGCGQIPLAFINLFNKYHIDYQGLIVQDKAVNALNLKP